MSIYLPDGMSRIDHYNRLRDALEGVGFLIVEDLMRMMDVSPDLCDARDFALAKADLCAMGYEERPLSLWGRRASFVRWEKVGFSPDELVARWGEDFVRKNLLR